MEKRLFEQRLEQLAASHHSLIYRKNEIDPNWNNGLFNRYRYPVLTAEHTPLFWRLT